MLKKEIRIALCAAFLSLSITGLSMAQDESWRVEIADGAVSVNGTVLPADAIPESLDLQGMTFQLQLPGFATPVVAIGEAVYVIEEDRIREATPEEINKYGVVSVYSLSRDDARDLVFSSLREIERNAAMVPSEQVQANVRGNAMRASQMVAALPHLEMQSYWNDVRKNDDALFKALMREAQVESEVAGLVDMIHKLPKGEPRDKAVAELRDQLVALFDMKQDNRRREIGELEQQLEVLTNRMKERENMKSRIVDHRMKELLGSDYK